MLKSGKACSILETHGNKRYNYARNVDCHKPLAEIMGLPFPWGKTHGKAKGTEVPDLLVMDVVNVKIMDF